MLQVPQCRARCTLRALLHAHRVLGMLHRGDQPQESLTAAASTAAVHWLLQSGHLLRLKLVVGGL